MTDAGDRDMTEGERRLWRVLRTKKFGSARFRRGVTIGPYRVAFACDAVPVVVEVDDTPGGRDPERDQWFFCHGYRVLLFRPEDVAASLDGLLSIVETEVAAAPRRPARVAGASAAAGREEGA
ncbi:DUF559 domain-containing protein [Rhodoplanes sp. TEM]|uniref:DUF559 domain-containing protein n=1 Tax=Rhodoplanes tepidamans TaxID=200616 RepID=A0ABT5JDY8_RHOTP|nr:MULTISPECIES: DUF559 domain-containing protein [Rhodoplanes]MDC7787668.1 DUF559 domain-containing protein [Rhodoplanes tepidamans]MDC7985936.1 DUF559 domain-containing protein [Rhodoplanes sp. TEM]MDQ0355240.1 very-short-patch-repair endonuclease [Rhodoplanes tepidamans]